MCRDYRVAIIVDSRRLLTYNARAEDEIDTGEFPRRSREVSVPIRKRSQQYVASPLPAAKRVIRFIS